MWNYKRSKKIVEAADAWDVLSSPKFEWLGSFKETLKKADFNDPNKMPTVFTMAQLVKYATQINYLKMAEKNINSYKDDLKFFGRNIVKFVDNHLKKIGSADSETFLILDYLGKITELLKRFEAGDVEIGNEGSSEESMNEQMKGLLSIGYKTLNLLNSRGVKINDSSMMFMMRDGDIKLGANPNNEDRKELIEKALEDETTLRLFQTHQGILRYLQTAEISNERQYELGQFFKAYSRSGLTPDKFMSLISEMIGVFNESLVKDIFLFTDTDNQIETFLFICIEQPNQRYYIDEFSKIICNYANQYTITESQFEKLRQNRDFKLDCEERGLNIRDIWLFNGFSTVETMLKYLEQFPEKLSDFKPAATRLLPNLQALKQKSIQAQNVILADGLDVIDKATKDGVIHKIDPFEKTWNQDYDPKVDRKYVSPRMTDTQKRELEIQNSSNQIFTNFQQSYADRMEQERQFTTVSKENLENYAKKLIILEFDGNHLSRFLKENKINKLQINGIDFVNGNWRGLFVPRFPTKSEGFLPAIVIRTDTYDSLEHHKQLAENLGIAHTKFTEGTRRHEIAHALHYLAVGDVMTTPSELMNPEVTKEEAYLLNPSEMYARTHGDIPYLSEIFKNRLSNLMVSQQVYEAAKEQWLQDIVNQKIHLMSGGTNLRRLLMEEESSEFKRENFGKIRKKDGTVIEIPDPQEAVLKILERQRNRLEMIFHEFFTKAGKRDFRRGLIQRRIKLQKELESLGEFNFNRKIEVEKELKEVEEDLIKSGSMLIFDVSDVSDSVLEGYLKDYFGKITDAVANGLLSSDVLDLEDTTRPKEEKTDDDSGPQKPRAEDIAEITRSLVDLSQKVPGGRKLDTIMPVHIGREVPTDSWTWKKDENPNDPNEVSKPMGNFPGPEPKPNEPQKGSKIKIEKTEENKDPFTADKKASVYNFRKSIN